ncbi:hypothetical protein [Stakelama tenebrarum]|uniref:Uncharacterized protein n=1 Tax=Stakelama tenebrarum TaxID=2711215 RepID=A0A6G6Y8Z5_9SPHN|nr:hypothetical protein [Sphingosinithalassobacter tenebrarum]QIG81389.1 hypothetical protein G5C33_17410 [Sphingosinithalassobacter tenebrarum]
MSNVERADRLGHARAMLFLAMAGLLVLNLAISIGDFDRSSRLIGWTLMVGVIALNLTGIGGWFKNAGLRRLLNDEVVQAHRRMAVTTGFWTGLVAMLAAMFATLSDPLLALPALASAVTATLGIALLHFAVLELRAAQ